MKWSVLLAFALATTLMVGLPAVAAADDDALQAGGERLVEMQNTDGGWGWQLTGPSASNTIGPIATGLARGYWHTEDPSFTAALALTGDYLLGKTAFSTSDGYLAMMLDSVFGGTTYRDHLRTNFYDKLEAGTYDRKGTNYDAAGYVNFIRTNRSGTIANLAAWDIGMGLVGAAACGADTSAWIDGAKAEIDELDSSGYYDVVGLAGALYGLAFVGEEFNPTAGQHAAATSLADLAEILAGYQIASSGGFTWNANYLNPGEDNETTQETGYAILALNEVDRMKYLDTIQDAADWLIGFQLATGGWMNYAGSSSENNEITAEAMWGIHTVYLQDIAVGPGGNDSGFGYGFVPFASIQRAVSMIQGLGGTVYVAPGGYAEPTEILISGDVDVVGTDGETTILTPGPGFAGSYLFRIVGGEGNISNLTLDGTGNLYGGVRYTGPGTGTLDNNIIKNIVSGTYSGFGVVVYADDVTVSNNVLTNIGRVGIWVGGQDAVVTGNQYTGKGAVDSLDYGIEVGFGGSATIIGNTITDCLATASSDGSASAGILVSDLYGLGTAATIIGNVLSNNTYGIAAGYGDADASVIVARFNSITGNSILGYRNPSVVVTDDAALNWWGSAEGPTHAGNPDGAGDAVSDNVIYSPWLGSNPDGDALLPGVQITDPLYIVVAPVGPEPTGGYLNTAIGGSNEITGVGAHTIGVRAGTYDASEPVTNAVSLLNEGGSAAQTVLTGPMSLASGNVRVGRFGQGFTVLGPITVGAGVDASTIHINWNCLFDSVTNEGLNTLDATFNYWGEDGPNTVGDVAIFPLLPVCADTIIEYIQGLGLTPLEAIEYAEMVGLNVDELDALLVVQLMREFGFGRGEAEEIVDEYGWFLVSHALSMAFGEYEEFSTLLLGYALGGPAGGGGGETEVHVVGDTIPFSLELLHPVTGEPITTGAMTASVLHTDENGDTWFVALEIMTYSEEEGRFVCSLDTTGYAPGIYEVVLGSRDLRHHWFQIELVEG